MAAAIASARAETDPAARALAAHHPLTVCNDAISQLSAIRRQALLELHDELGWSWREIAQHMGLSRNHVANIVRET